FKAPGAASWNIVRAGSSTSAHGGYEAEPEGDRGRGRRDACEATSVHCEQRRPHQGRPGPVTARASASRRGTRVREREVRYDVASGPVVVDASMAAVWFTNEHDRRGAVRLLCTESMLLAPALVTTDATNYTYDSAR